MGGEIENLGGSGIKRVNVTSIRGVNVSATAPTNGQVLVYDSTEDEWAPGAEPIGSVDAANVTYEPTTPGDWTTAPEDVEAALDEAASRVTALEAGGGGGGFEWTTLTADTDYNTTAASAYTVTMVTDQTANIVPGMLMRATLSSEAVYYLRVKTITADLLTVYGADLPTSLVTIDTLEYNSRRDAIGYVEFHVAGNWCDATNTALLESDNGWKGGFAWPLPSAYILGMRVIERVASGSPVVNLTVGGSDLLSSGLVVGTTAADSAGEIIYAASDVATGAAIELTCTTAVATGNEDLTVGVWFFVPGSV